MRRRRDPPLAVLACATRDLGHLAWGDVRTARRAADATARTVANWSDLPQRRRADILLTVVKGLLSW